MSSAPEAVRRRNLRLLGVLAALFFVPVLLSFVLYYGTQWRPASLVNHGSLIIPPRPLPRVSLPGAGQGAFRGKWSLVYVGDGRCEAACRQALQMSRQTRLALNNEMTRVQRVFLASEACCDREFLEQEHPGLIVVDASGAHAASLLALFPPTVRAHSVFIVDPLGNLMMSYDARENPRGLLMDLQKLLRLSHIG
jgi:hypothetical protein